VVFAAFATGVLVFEGYASPWSPVFVGKHLDQIPSLKPVAYRGLPAAAQKGAQLMTVEGCLACHMINGVGGQRGPNLSAIGDRLNEPELIWRIARGGGGMPAYGPTIKPKQLREIIAFLESRTANAGLHQIAGQGSTTGSP
jgi:ubiquinol-cytochrome c reductase cytochrome b subunit